MFIDQYHCLCVTRGKHLATKLLKFEVETMADVASLLSEIESAQQRIVAAVPHQHQFFGSLFDNDEEEEDLSNIPLFESCEEIERKHQAF